MTKRSEAIREASLKGYVVRDGMVFSPKGNQRKLTRKVSRGMVYYSFNVNLSNSNRFPIPVHRLVAFQKFGEAALERGIHTRHLDGNPLNNLEENIALGTPTENIMDRPKEDRQSHAAKAGQKLTSEFVEKLRRDHADGLGYKKLRAKYGIGLSQLSYYLSSSAKRTTFNFARG